MSSGVFNEGIINNALLESFTVHARVLLDFLFAENPSTTTRLHITTRLRLLQRDFAFAMF